MNSKKKFVWLSAKEAWNVDTVVNDYIKEHPDQEICSFQVLENGVNMKYNIFLLVKNTKQE